MKKLIIRGMESGIFSEKLIEWYQIHQRALPWRETTDPFKIWLSEIMLQQTRVQQGLPYYEKFIREFPSVDILAEASEEKVLRLWQGLGYYTRARNLHACAKKVMAEYNGIFPSSYEKLLKLPGIGEYTAAAIASIAGNEPVAVVDGNVFRVLSRIFGIDTPINSPEGKRAFTSLANQLIPRGNPSAFNQAIMEFGALHCTPRNPLCDTCIFKRNCIAKARDLQQDLPVKLRTVKNRKRYFYYFVLRHGNSMLMRLRNGKDIWKGLYDFYLIENNRDVRPEQLIEKDELLSSLMPFAHIEHISGYYKHILTHQTILSRVVVMKLRKKPALLPESLQFHSLKKVHDLPKPVLISRFLHDFKLLS